MGTSQTTFRLKQTGNVLKTSSLPEVFCKKGVLRNFTRFTRKYLCQSLFFKTLLKRDSSTGVFL